MAFLELKIDLARVAIALERIADALDRYIPMSRKVDTKPAGVDNLFVFDPEKEWEKQQEEERQKEAGKLPGSRRSP